MRKPLFAFSIIALLLSGCEEAKPAIDFSEPVIPLKDTTYIDNVVPTAQHKAVLIEYITGVHCSNCPVAAKKAKDIRYQKTADSIVILTLYAQIASLPFTTPYAGAPVLISEKSTQIVEALGKPDFLPNGYVDRRIFMGKQSRGCTYQEWTGYVNERLKEKTAVNIGISKSISTRKLKVEIKLQYNSNITSGNAHKYAIYVIEDSIVSSQLELSGTNSSYVHDHVLRHSIGLPIGNPLKETAVPGRTYIKQFEYEIPTEYVIDNCHVVCVVLDSVTEEVINVREIPLK